MATIRKRATTWQVQVRRKGFPPISGTFATKAEAEAWGRLQEVQQETGPVEFQRPAQSFYKLRDLLVRTGQV